ncbi:MAG: chemotaxis protein CheW [Desulfobacteraceae bacterium]|nr:chemotaxis protein CheW [Desulfobacteraceae bacterium]
MLFLKFQIGGDVYALDCSYVVEIVPMVQLREISKAPPYLPGVFQYRGQVVPVIDLCSLAGFDAARQVLSTRIVIVRIRDAEGGERILGIVAERIVEIVRVEEGSLAQTGVAIGNAPYLGKMITSPQGLVQCILPEGLVSSSLGQVLFPTGNGGSLPE